MPLKHVPIYLTLVGSLFVAGPALAEEKEDDVEEPTEGEVPEPDSDLGNPYPVWPRFAMKWGAGSVVENIAGGDFFGAYGELAFGADRPDGGIFLAMSAAGGRTGGGLDYQEFLFGMDFEWPVEFMRLGVRPRIGWIGVDRVTKDAKMEAFRGGVGLYAGADVFSSAGWVVDLNVEPRIDAVDGVGYLDDPPPYPAFGVRFGIGVRLRR